MTMTDVMTARLRPVQPGRTTLVSVLDIEPESFDPPPQVRSAIVRMTPLPARPDINPALLGELVTVAFSQRRKVLRNTLGHWLEERRYGGDFDLQRRAEEVPVADYLALASAVGPP